MDKKIKQIIQAAILISVLLTIIVNSLSNILPINDKTTQELSDALPNLFVPAGLTFSIWGVIYILLILFAIYQAKDLFKKEKNETKFVEKIGILFIISSFFNILWIFLWHYEQMALSLLVMLGLFASLLLIYLKLEVGKTKVSLKEKIFVHLPFSVYLGWITVATIANVTALLVKIEWDGFGIEPHIWTMLVIIVVAIITILILVTRKDYGYSAVIIWALIGIYIKRSADDKIFGVQTDIANIALISIIVILIVAILRSLFCYIKK